MRFSLCLFFVVFSLMSFASLSAEETPLSKMPARVAPDWVCEGVIYQINPRAFTPEGTLQAAEEKLPHVAELGVTIVYLCPVFRADDDENQQFWSPRQKASKMNNPKNPYRMKDYYHVDEEYGTDEDLKSFVASAHKLGMRVLLDMVYLHCGPKAVFIEEHPDFVKRDENGEILNAAWAFPGLNFQSAELREYLWKNMEYWVEEFDVDGFRLDVADGIPLDFWIEARKRLEKIRPNIAMLAEGSRPQDQLFAFDLNYGFPFSSKLRGVYDKNSPASEIRKIKETMASNNPRGARFVHYIDNHDISNDDYENRIEKRWGEAGVDAALALIFTLDGTPMLYCGQEICDTRRHSIFGNQNGVHIHWTDAETPAAGRRISLLKKLAHLRATHPELTRGELVWLENSAPDDVLSFARVLGEKRTFVAINFRNRPVAVEVEGKTLRLDPFGIAIEPSAP
ncbi:MAG: alpha-amylase family glycosyl hydrolase [Planctomycetia bacterium]|nr:alpha-amylase family glycosyl hydrolase [Planctomycetia bacterium]